MLWFLFPYLQLSFLVGQKILYAGFTDGHVFGFFILLIYFCFVFSLSLMPLQSTGLFTTIQLWLPPPLLFFFYPELNEIMDSSLLRSQCRVSIRFSVPFEFALALAMSHIVSLENKDLFLSVDPNFKMNLKFFL